MNETSRPFTESEMIRLARSGVHKIDLLGERGASLVTTDELVAMATTLVCLGLFPAARADAPSATRPDREAGVVKALRPAIEGALREALTPRSNTLSKGGSK